MLGYESNLVPVVGFHSNGESVRVNFGVAPFTYEVSVAPLARKGGHRGGGYSGQHMPHAVVVTVDISSRRCRHRQNAVACRDRVFADQAAFHS